MRFAILAFALVVSQQAQAQAQKKADHIKLGIAAYQAVKPAEALQHFQAVLAGDSMDYEANWRAARAAVDLAYKNRTNPDSAFGQAERYARRAVASDSTRMEGHAMLAVIVGSSALSGNQRGKYANAQFPKLFERVRESMLEAKRAIALDPKYDAGYRVLGLWQANVAGLPQQQRDIADPVLGDLVQEISVENGIKNLEKAIQLNPSNIAAHMALAQVYAGHQRYAEARSEFATVDSLPIAMLSDSTSKQRAKQQLAKLPAK